MTVFTFSTPYRNGQPAVQSESMRICQALVLPPFQRQGKEGIEQEENEVELKFKERRPDCVDHLLLLTPTQLLHLLPPIIREHCLQILPKGLKLVLSLLIDLLWASLTSTLITGGFHFFQRSFFVLPSSYRRHSLCLRTGHGGELLQAVYEDALKRQLVYEVTVEDPCPGFVRVGSEI